MTTALTSRTSIPVDTLLARLADRWRPAGLFVASFTIDGTLAWLDPHAPRVLSLAASSPAITAAIRAATDNAESTTSPLTPFTGITVGLAPITRRRRITGWIAVIARTAEPQLSEDLQRAAGKAQLDAQALVSQAARLPAVADFSVEPLTPLVAQMYEDMHATAVSSQELSGVASELGTVYEQISILCKISGGMRFSQKPGAFLDMVCNELLAIGNFRAVALAQATQDEAGRPVITDVSSMVGQWPVNGKKLIESLKGPIHESLAAGKTIITNNFTSADDSAAAQCFVCVPLVRESRTLGILLAIEKTDGAHFTSVDQALLDNVGNQCSIFLENASLYQDMQDLFMGVLHALTRSIDAKDAYTRGHSQRVAELSRALARKVGLPEEQCERIYLSGLLHDVGKIGVPENVLIKPGRLTDAEFEAIKKHPEIGAQILSNIKQLQDIIPGVLYHHERWDGKGYPYGKSSDDIPLMGRIICVADSFDAMSSTRTYRPALPLDTVLKEIQRCAGAQFDPALAAAFITLDFEPYSKSIEEHLTFRQLPGWEGLP